MLPSCSSHFPPPNTHVSATLRISTLLSVRNILVVMIAKDKETENWQHPFLELKISLVVTKLTIDTKIYVRLMGSRPGFNHPLIIDSRLTSFMERNHFQVKSFS